MRTRALVPFILAAVGCCSCNEHASPQTERVERPRAPTATNHHDEPAHEALPRRVRLDPQVIIDAEIKTLAVTRESLAATLELPGEISFDPDRTARVSALVGGRIESVHFKEGQRVDKGALLAIIKVPELGKAKAAYTSTAAKAAAARSNADRLQALAQQRLAATQEVLAATAEADALESEARAAQEQLQALGTAASDSTRASQLSLLAPIKGDVVARDAVVGQPVAPDQIIATIADLSEVWFLGRVFEKNLGQVHVGALVEIQLNAYPREKFSGSVEYLGKQVDPTARAVTARIRMTNRADLLRIGLFGVARVATGAAPADTRPAIVVPRSAITEIGNKPVVFVRQPDGDFDVHEIVLGDGALGKVQVLNGLRDGEQVVVDGVFTLKSAVLKSTFGEED